MARNNTYNYTTTNNHIELDDAHQDAITKATLEAMEEAAESSKKTNGVVAGCMGMATVGFLGYMFKDEIAAWGHRQADKVRTKMGKDVKWDTDGKIRIEKTTE